MSFNAGSKSKAPSHISPVFIGWIAAFPVVGKTSPAATALCRFDQPVETAAAGKAGPQISPMIADIFFNGGRTIRGMYSRAAGGLGGLRVTVRKGWKLQASGRCVDRRSLRLTDETAALSVCDNVI